MLTPGTKLGPYEIVAAVGAGGMGEVYRARDPRLGRDVAIKVSGERFSDRFEREARAIAALNHPHICTLHDVGPNYLVMEFVDGPTLADRIQQGAIPLDEALAIARQIADALDAAHARGIVHRDLKPANVKLTPDGAVKVLDFGLAKAPAEDSEQPPSGSASMSPTMSPATQLGVILGTAAYMAPEQARGLVVDKRADIWAFGVVLYEMLKGGRLFRGDTTSDTIAAVLTLEPAWDVVDERVRPLLQRCLAKDPKQRLRDIGDVDLLLRDAPAAAVPTKRSSWAAWSVAAAALVAAAVLAVVNFREQAPAPVRASIRFQIPTTITLAASGNLGLSPDGRQLAFLGTGADGIVRLWLRAMDSLEVHPIDGSETSVNAPPFFWSQDSRSIAFDAGGVLKRVSVSGGLAQTICDVPMIAIGGSWNARGDIILGNVVGGILRVNEHGGVAAPITALDPSRKENGHMLPSFLSDGRHFVYERVSRSSPDQSGIYVGELDAKPDAQSRRRLLPYAPGLTYAPPATGAVGHLLFIREGILVAQPFDEQRLELAGDAAPLAQQVGTYLDTAFFSISHNGMLVYRAADPAFPITWYDRRGTAIGVVSDPGQYSSLALAPDGTRAVAALINPRDRANSDLWLLDLAAGGGPARFTFNTGMRMDFPIWSPDARRVVFRSSGPGQLQLVQKAVNGVPDSEQTLLPSSGKGLVTPTSWSPNGRFILLAETDRVTGWDISALALDGDQFQRSKHIAVMHSRFNEQDGHFSPDGRWVAYVSNESGTNELYVRAFNPAASAATMSLGGSVLVSRGGGTSPHWRGDGKELFYLAPNEKMMAVGVTLDREFHAGTPTPLFQAPQGAIVGDVTRDGQRFLMVQSATAPFTVVVNWAKP